MWLSVAPCLSSRVARVWRAWCGTHEPRASPSTQILNRRWNVEYASGRLLIKAPKGWRQYSFRGGGESIAVQIELPAGSQLRGEVGDAALHCTGRLGECHFKAGVGDIHVAEAGPVQLKTGAGDITVEHAVGHAEVTTGSGAVRIDSLDGTAVVKNSNGDTWIGEITGDLRVSAATGSGSGEQIRCDRDITGLGELISHTTHPIRQPEDLMDDDHGGRRVFDLGIREVALNFPVAMFDRHPFMMTWRFLQARFSPFLGRRRHCQQAKS